MTLNLVLKTDLEQESIHVLLQRYKDVNVKVYAWVNDFEKAFAIVKQDKLIAILEEVGLDGRDICNIDNLYWSQTANIKISTELSDKTTIKNLFAENIFLEALDGKTTGGVMINNLRYVDDTILLAANITDLQNS